MMWFFSILIVIIGMFFYIFSSNTKTSTLDTNIPSLDMIDNSVNIKEIKTTHYKTNPVLSEELPKSIPQEQTFDLLKEIIRNLNHTSFNITLNSRINSYIYTEEDKQKFKLELSKAFEIPQDEIEKNYEKNKLVWDWVNQLKD